VNLAHLRKALPVWLIYLAIFAEGQSPLRKGTYDADCSGYTFHLSRPQPRANGELTLRLNWSHGLYPPAWESAGWYPITAKRCPSNSLRCEDATDAKIRFEKIGKRIVGDFALVFANGQQEGKFEVKYHHSGVKMICE
jgi:hypothetical protein